MFIGIKKELFRKFLYLGFFSNHKDTAQLRILLKYCYLNINSYNMVIFLNFKPNFCEIIVTKTVQS